MNQQSAGQPPLPSADYDDDENIVNPNIQGGRVVQMYARSTLHPMPFIGGGSSNGSRDPSGDPPPQVA